MVMQKQKYYSIMIQYWFQRHVKNYDSNTQAVVLN